jgi:hypothetical protein
MAVLIWANAASRADLETGGFIAGLPWRAAFQIEFAGIYRFFSSLGKREAGGICVFLAMPADRLVFLDRGPHVPQALDVPGSRRTPHTRPHFGTKRHEIRQ